jgi:hypothetical protein
MVNVATLSSSGTNLFFSNIRALGNGATREILPQTQRSLNFNNLTKKMSKKLFRFGVTNGPKVALRLHCHRQNSFYAPRFLRGKCRATGTSKAGYH